MTGTAHPTRASSETYLQAVGRRLWASTGAKLGLAWLSVVAVGAVFAPLLASSHPLVWQTAEGVSSPWLEHASATDLALPLLTAWAVGVLAWWGRRRAWSAGRRLAWVVGGGSVIIAACWMVADPPVLVIYDRYRVAETSGAVDWSVEAPIPYSATDRLRDLGDRKLEPPGADHLLGTTLNNADMASRLIHACRIALAIGFIATGIALVIGVILGGLMGYFSGWVDLLGMRLVEVFEAVPQIYLLLSFVAFIGRDLYLMMAVIGFLSWTGYARFVRAEFLKLRQQDFVLATRALGLPLWSTLFRHILPNGVAPVLVTASFGIASAILVESFLSFLGLGLVDEPSWGGLLNQALTGAGGFNWWIALFPGLAIFLTVFAYNLIGEALRDAIDPKV